MYKSFMCHTTFSTQEEIRKGRCSNAELTFPQLFAPRASSGLPLSVIYRGRELDGGARMNASDVGMVRRSKINLCISDKRHEHTQQRRRYVDIQPRIQFHGKELGKVGRGDRLDPTNGSSSVLITS